MAKLVYAAIASLDGYVADSSGDFGWAAPDEQVHAFVNRLEAPIGTYLYGRRMYEVMRYWAGDDQADRSEVSRDYRRIWQGADKIVYSASLESVTTPRTDLRNVFDPQEVRALKAGAAQDLSIGGPHLAGAAVAAGLVDEIHLFLVPEIVGGGTAALPHGLRKRLRLLAVDRFDSGVVHLHHAVTS